MKFILTLLSLMLLNVFPKDNPALDGAWELRQNNNTTVVLIQNNYITWTTYTGNSFGDTRGGFLTVDGNKLKIRQEFNTAEKDLKEEQLNFSVDGGNLQLGNVTFTRIDNGKAPLSGVWRITERMEEGKMNQIHQTGTRKTLKMLTGTRFQWFAIDPVGNKFSGTGGGTYTFGNGEYVENIEFFSRDASRVGASLVFKDHLEDAKWHHTGLSSRGANIYEIWENAFIAE